MIYVPKTNQNAIDFVSKFLERGFNDEDSRYMSIGFDEIKNPVNDFREFFISEQNAKCCYCCRTIENSNKTELEHIIPRARKKVNEFEPYYALSDVLKHNVIPQNVFEISNTQLQTPPYPHHVAYHNIVASCDGRALTYIAKESFTCCNRNRKDVFVPPFNLMENSIEYLFDGTIVYRNDRTSRVYFEILNLDKPLFKQIRRLWFLFSMSILNLNDVLNDQFTETINEKIVAFAIANSDSPVQDNNNLTTTFSNMAIWNVFKQYDFFFDYYRKRK